MNNPDKAMIMGAGLGKRMRPLTNDTPKPLIKFNNKPLIDYILDSLDNNKISATVINVHYLADKIEQHLSNRTSPTIHISDERDQLLETGGGAKKAIHHFAEKPFIILNSDSIWNENNGESIQKLLSAWDPEIMDCLLLLAESENSIGYDGDGDFFISDDGRLTRRQQNEKSPYVFAGASIIKPELFANAPEGAFSLNVLWNHSINNGSLYGVIHDKQWLHIGTPEALKEAEEQVNIG